MLMSRSVRGHTCAWTLFANTAEARPGIGCACTRRCGDMAATLPGCAQSFDAARVCLARCLASPDTPLCTRLLLMRSRHTCGAAPCVSMLCACCGMCRPTHPAALPHATLSMPADGAVPRGRPMALTGWTTPPPTARTGGAGSRSMLATGSTSRCGTPHTQRTACTSPVVRCLRILYGAATSGHMRLTTWWQALADECCNVR